MTDFCSCSSNWVYDVFPSFRGEDVRVTFLGHFLKELDRKLIVSFKDNEIERGQSLDPKLRQAIRTSRIAVVVFSENYPSSSWCLDEMMEIVKCKEESGQLVIPIFYGLDPSHVRKQTGKFGEVFNKTCQRKTEEEIKLWRNSLTDVANLVGYHSTKWESEAKMIEAIANEVLAKLNITPAKDFEDFVGMEDHIAKMSVLLNLESQEVRMVGIWGSSGIGKTTIARFLFNQLSRQFQASVYIDKAFVSRSMEIYSSVNPDDYNMKLHLLRRFLSEILEIKDMRIDCLDLVQQRLKHHKVLIFIDDLDDQMVLDTLAGQSQWFGSGSRIIVITKDKHLLRAHGIIDHVYEVCLPSKKVALEIFCRSAFRQDSPPEGMMEIASQVANSAGNLPLGLKVLGSYLRGREKEDLMGMLHSLGDRLNGKIGRTLRVGYDGLNNKKDEAIFRHIACLFNCQKFNDIKLMLADSDLDVNIGLKNLVDKSLINVRWEKVEMHQLLEDMGKEIVREQSKEPGEREFLMDSKEICDVLEDNSGTKKVLGISLNLDEIDELHMHENAFKGMRNLRFLNIYTCDPKKEVTWHLPESLDCFPSKLRLLRFDGYPLRYMPFNFRPENLIKLQMQGSKLERLWEGVHSLRGLKHIDLQKSRSLKEIPDLSMATNLETLLLGDCSKLVDLPSSVQYLNKLKVLDMSFCVNLETLPTGINLQSLKWLILKGCSRLKIFPKISTNISTLSLDETAIDEFFSILPLKKLISLSMCRMKSEKLWEGEQTLALLMSMLPHSLETLSLSHIPNLLEIPSSIQKFHKLKELQIKDCINLETLPTDINLPLLWYLDLSGCSRLRTFPNISTNIKHLVLMETGIEEVPWWIMNFSTLATLVMSQCNSLQRVSLNIFKLKSLTHADFTSCGALTGGDSSIYPNIDTVPEDTFSSLPYKDGHVLLLRNCYKLDLVTFLDQLSTTFMFMEFSGEEVPSYFTHQTTRTTLTDIPLLDTRPPQPCFIFRACAVVADDLTSATGDYFVKIQVKCRFKGAFGNVFDSGFHVTTFGITKDATPHLYLLDCYVPLSKDNAQLNYDRVDITLYVECPVLEIKEWGIRLLENFSSPPLHGYPNTPPHVCEADEENMVNKAEYKEECRESGDSSTETDKNRKRKRVSLEHEIEDIGEKNLEGDVSEYTGKNRVSMNVGQRE